jgi:hypothetical protein
MPVIYETKAKIDEKGHLVLEVDDLPFDKGTQFLVKLIPQFQCDPEIFKGQMQMLIETCAKNNPYAEMNKEQILSYLRHQRLEMYHETAEN